VKTDPELCHKRVAKRNRNSESTIELGYLNNCHENHELWMNSKNDDFLDLLTINGNVEFETEEDQKNLILKDIQNYLLKFVSKENPFFNQDYVLF
jgi:deoxyadenosine/deoxycytidine kinase